MARFPREGREEVPGRCCCAQAGPHLTPRKSLRIKAVGDEARLHADPQEREWSDGALGESDHFRPNQTKSNLWGAVHCWWNQGLAGVRTNYWRPALRAAPPSRRQPQERERTDGALWENPTISDRIRPADGKSNQVQPNPTEGMQAKSGPRRRSALPNTASQRQSNQFGLDST